jgi:hypothetical protein
VPEPPALQVPEPLQPVEQPAAPVKTPLNFGQQIAVRGGLPKDVETRIRQIEEAANEK